MFGLKRTDLDFEKRVIRIRRTLDAATRLMHAPKSRSSSADLPIPEALANRLRTFLAKHWPENEADLLFCNNVGKPMVRNKVALKLQDTLKDLKIERAALHAFRHMAASELAGRRRVTIRGATSNASQRLANAEGKTHENRPELTNLSTQLEALLVDQSGRVVCHGAGVVPKEGGPCQDYKVWIDEEIAARRQREWVLMSGPDDAYYHVNCLNMKLKPSDSYTLTLRISAVDPNTPGTNLIPTLEGGQLDLP